MDNGIVYGGFDAVLLSFAKMNLALAGGGNADQELREVNAQLLESRRLKPDAFPLIVLDAFQNLFRVVKASGGTREERAARLAADAAVLLEGLDYPETRLLLELEAGFSRWRKNFALNYAEADGIYTLSGQLGVPLLCYLTRREILNLLMSGAAFLQRLDLCHALVADMDAADDALRNQAQSLGSKLFFYEGWEE